MNLIYTLSWFISVLILTDVGISAGVAVHLAIANRVRSLKVDSETSYYAGAFFPDAFYNCFDLSQAAEDAHWPPFTMAAVNYYRENYTLKGETNRKLKDFIFGLFTHQVADVSWHSLQSSQGFLEMISVMEFDGDNQAAHNFIDVAGDFILIDAQLQNLSDKKLNNLIDFYNMKWEYPAQDILNILKTIGHSEITKAKLGLCLERGLIGLKSEISTAIAKRKTNNKYDFSLQKSPLFSISIMDYYYGGLNQIVNLLESCVMELNDWFSGNEPEDPWSICKPTFKKHDTNIAILESIYEFSELFSSVSSYYFDENTVYISPIISGSQFGYSVKVGEYLGELTLAVGAPFEEKIGSSYMIPVAEILNPSFTFEKRLKSLRIQPQKTLSHTYPSRFGNKLANWNIEEFDFLVVSEPGVSTIKIFHGKNLVAIIGSSAFHNIIGTKGAKQLDILLSECFDVDRDGSCDLVIGSPYTDDLGYYQSGQILILKGKKFISIIRDQLDKSVATYLDINRLISHKYYLPLSLRQENGYDHFGSSFALTKSYVLVSVGSIGSVVVFERENSFYYGVLNENGFFLSSQMVSAERFTSSQSQLFGLNFILTGVHGNKEWILISKSFDSFDGQCVQCGSAVLFEIDDSTFKKVTTVTPIKPNLLSNVSLEFVFGKFASNAIKIGAGSVILSSPGYGDGRGALYLIKIDDILNQEIYEKFTPSYLFHVGDEGIGFSNFGSALEAFIYAGKYFVVIGMPQYGIGYVAEPSSALAGYVKIIELK